MLGLIIIYLFIGIIIFYQKYKTAKEDFNNKYKNKTNKEIKKRLELCLVYEINNKIYRMGIDINEIISTIFFWPYYDLKEC